MKVQIEELEVHFPYDFIYQEQYDYMYNLKKALDAKGLHSHLLLDLFVKVFL